MARTKAQAFTKKKKKVEKAKKKSDGQDSDQTQTTRPKRLTVKQLLERRKIILETIERANKEFLGEKENLLGEKPLKPRKISFDNCVKCSDGQEGYIKFEDGDSAKRLMNLGVRPTTITIEPPTTRSGRKIRKAEGDFQDDEKPVLKKVKKNK